jgi:hypothetical protein
MFAPQVDHLIQIAQPQHQRDNQPLTKSVEHLVGEIKKLKVQGDDDFRSLFIEADRGVIEDYGDFDEFREEGAVDSYEDFVELWKCDYPVEKKWYKLTFSEYQKVYYIAIDGKIIIQADAAILQENHHNDKLCDWLFGKVYDTVVRLSTDADAYHTYVEKNMSFPKRYGKILRSDYWTINVNQKNYFQADFSDDDIKRFKLIVETCDAKTAKNRMSRINAGDFFNYCRIGYEANGYFANSKKQLDAREMYLAMADGRDCGLRDISLDSDEEFMRWYHNESHCGGHPWEICRGGNSTHISLYVHRDENRWMLILAGSSCSRAVEIIKMALALHQNNIPFNLRDAEALYKMVTGADYIGIVPEHIIPRYCHALFPEKDRIIDFMNLDNETEADVIKKAVWYPLNKIELG